MGFFDMRFNNWNQNVSVYGVFFYTQPETRDDSDEAPEPSRQGRNRCVKRKFSTDLNLFYADTEPKQ